MGPKKRRAANNKENLNEEKQIDVELESFSIEPIIKENLEKFDEEFHRQVEICQKRIEEKFQLAREEFDRYLEIHQAQLKLSRLLDAEIVQNQEKQRHNEQNHDLMNKTVDLMNASLADSSRTKTYLIGEFKRLPVEMNKNAIN